MTISSGFFNSVSGDRKYNARHFNEIFDGMLKDGVYTTIGDQFNVTAGSGMQVIVGTGRGWFRNTWIYNDASVPFNITSADPVYKRIDAIVIDVDTGTQVRNDDIKYIMGTAASTPDKPTLIDTPTHKQYPLAWIMVNAGVTAITSGNITDCKLTGEIPAVEAILEYSSRTKSEIDERFERDEKPSFTESQTEDNIVSGESIFIIFGKIQKFINIIKGKLPVKFGGTGKNTFTENSVLLGNAANAVKEKTSNTGAFYSDGPGQEPVFGTLPVNKGGTGATTAAQALTNLGVPSDVSKAMSKDVYCSQDTNRVLIDLAHGGTGTNNGTINGVRLMKSGSTMGYYDANGTFKSFRQPTGNAGAAQVLSGYTFANASSDAVTGTMANYSGSAMQTVATSAGTGTQQCGLGAGYHTGVKVDKTATYNSGVHAQKTVNWTEEFYLWITDDNARAEAEFGLCNVYSWKITSKGSAVNSLKAIYRDSSGSGTVQSIFDVSVNTTYTPPGNAYYLILIGYTSAAVTTSDKKVVGTFTKYADKLHT